jgi:hypothetical protein
MFARWEPTKVEPDEKATFTNFGITYKWVTMTNNTPAYVIGARVQVIFKNNI